jgi:hypothetical protein
MNAAMRNSVGMAICLVLLSALPGSAVPKTDGTQPKIAQVYFAQHHVLTPDNPLFKLVGNLEALIKVQVYSQTVRQSPAVYARLKLGSKTLDLPLKGPARLPQPPTSDPVLLEHKYEDSFTAVIPKEWIVPGLRLTVELKEGALKILDTKVYDKLAIGAPTKLVLTMFDIHFFGGDKAADYPRGWFEGLGAKLPVAELELRRVRNISFDKLVMIPRADKPATLCGSREEYQKKTGIKFDGEQDTAGMWNAALKEAAGAGWGGTHRLYYANIYGVFAGGQAGGLSGVGNGKMHGILLHELGHAFGLPDLVSANALGKYPYVGPMHGIPAPENSPHVGPTWGFDLSQLAFLSPRTMAGEYGRDPMGGGGANKDGGPGLYRFFSDYHCSRIRDCLEKTQLIRDDRGRYLEWNQQTGLYSTVARQQGQPNCPVEDDVDVISVLASASMATLEANFVYPPIGPYTAGFIRSFDDSLSGRSMARGAGYDDSTCHVCLRVTQGGKVTTYLVNDKMDPKTDAKDPKSIKVFAINLPARGGEITKVELLFTPGVISKGVAKDCKVLSSWSRPSSGPSRTETVTATYPARQEPAGSTKPGKLPSGRPRKPGTLPSPA